MTRLPVFLLLAALSGCGLAQFGGEGIDRTTTGSIAPAAPSPPVDPLTASPVLASVAPEDWESMRSLAAAKLDKTANGTALDWSNATTGDSGTMTPLAEAKASKGGISCRPVALTVSDVKGVRRYAGNACTARGAWQLADIAAEDMDLVVAEAAKARPASDPASLPAVSSTMPAVLPEAMPAPPSP